MRGRGMIAPARRQTTIRTLALAALFCGVAPAAFAQAVPTAGAPVVGISQEQLLALTARMDALEKHNDELEAQILDLKAQASAGDQAIREQVNTQPAVTLNN